jgi:CheY-like chemotaxis protein
MKVLIIDNNTSIQYLFKVELEDEGYDVIVASTGKEALEKIEAENPDVVTMEMLLPDTDGIDLLRFMKGRRPNTPVIITTAFDYRDDFAFLPSDAYLLKSSDLKDLKEYIRRYAELHNHGYTGRETEVTDKKTLCH